MLQKDKTSPAKGFNVTRISARNFLGLQEVEIEPTGKVTCITGKNGAGKTSILEAINLAFSGGLSEKHIHKGADSAEILIDLDAFSIKRKITKSGTKTLKVFSGEGFERGKPQAYLDAIVGKFAFSPIDFAFAPTKERNEILLNALNVEYSVEDAIKDGVITEEGTDLVGLGLVNFLEKTNFDNRQNINRSVKSAKSTVEELKAKLPVDFGGFDKTKYDEVLRVLAEKENRKSEIENTIIMADQQIATEKSAIKRIEDISSELKFVKINVVEDFSIVENEKEIATNDCENLRKEIEILKESETKMRDDLAYFEIQTTLKTFDEKIPKGETKSKELTEIIEKLRGEIKTRLISNADLSIDGLEFLDGIFLVNGVEIELLSESEKLKIGLEIAKKLNEDFRILCVDGVEKLDPESLDQFSADIEKSGFQCFMTTCHTAPTNAQKVSV